MITQLTIYVIINCPYWSYAEPNVVVYFKVAQTLYIE